MRLGLLTAPFPRRSLKHVAEWAAGEGFQMLEVACWPAAGGERRRYSGTSHIDVTRVEAAAAFLALHFAHFFGWYHGARPLGATGANEFLAVNIGIPVAAHDDAKSYAVFKRIVAAGFALGPFATDLDKDLVRQTYTQSGDQLPEGFYLIPELAAAVARTVQADNHGYHMLPRLHAVGLGCALERARELVYADGVNLDNQEAAVPVGVTCRLCDRTDCEQRAFPPLRQPLVIDENVRGVSLFAPTHSDVRPPPPKPAGKRRRSSKV